MHTPAQHASEHPAGQHAIEKFSLDDVLTIEGDDPDPLDFAKSMQRAINSGMAWRLQGSYGRSAMAALEEGVCMLGRQEQRDAYGHIVPSRDQVKAGTKGSYELVAARYGEEYANTLRDL